MTRSRVALVLIGTLIALTIFTVSHIHGVSDPGTHHSFIDHLIFAQACAGFLIALAGLAIFLRAALGGPPAASAWTPAPRAGTPCPTRSPPVPAS